MQHAKLYDGNPTDGDMDLTYYEVEYLPKARGSPSAPSTALRWLAGMTDMDALLDVEWRRDVIDVGQGPQRQNAPSTIRAQFMWSTPGDMVDMSLTDACLTLEHWVDWRG